MLSLCTASSSSTATVTHAIHYVYTCGCQNMPFLAKLIGALKLDVYAGETIPGLSRILTLLSVASGYVNEGASQVTVEMRYKGRAAHHRLIDCKYIALCACAEELWPVLTAIDYSFECSNTGIPFDTEVRSIDCQAMIWVFACHALLNIVPQSSGRLAVSVAEPAGSQQDSFESSKQPSQILFSLH